MKLVVNKENKFGSIFCIKNKTQMFDCDFEKSIDSISFQKILKYSNLEKHEIGVLVVECLDFK